MRIVEKCRYSSHCMCICMCMESDLNGNGICRERSRFAVCLVLETAVGAMPLGSRWDVANLAECVTDTKKSAGSKGGTTPEAADKEQSHALGKDPAVARGNAQPNESVEPEGA